ncbi:MAG TPA: hypothetical protein PLQ90_02275, partial [Sphaerochaeta sp.]|nr:hypothetical protein [Sphaerochaeta sp.]
RPEFLSGPYSSHSIYTHQRKEMQSSKQHQNTQPYRNEEEHGECIENKQKQTGKCQAIQLEKK